MSVVEEKNKNKTHCPAKGVNCQPSVNQLDFNGDITLLLGISSPSGAL